MKRLLIFLVFLATRLSAATISGTVTDAVSHAPLAMTVQAYDASGMLKISASSDASGRFELTLTSGMYHVLAFDPNGTYATNFYADAESFETSRTLALDQSLTNINFALVRAGRIAGVVRSIADAPLEAITVAVYNADGTRRGFTTTDALGNYALVVPPGTYTVAAYDEALMYLTSVALQAVGVDEGKVSTIDFHLARAAVVSGTISDAATSAPIGNARISAYVNDVEVATTTSDASGKYRLLVPASKFRIVASDPAGAFATTYAANAESFDTSSMYTLAAGETLALNLQLARGGRLAGQITDAVTGLPLAAMTVAAFNPDGTTRGFTTTDANGMYTLVVPPGLYRLAAYDPGLVYLRRFAANEILFARALPLAVFASQTTTANLALPRGAIVGGQVTSSALEALAGITISAYDGSGLAATATSDASGFYRLLLEPGSYNLAAFDPAFHWATSYLTRPAPSTVNFALVTGAHVSGVVTTSTGLSVGDMQVVGYDANGIPVSTAITSSSGSFNLVLPPGTYRFAAYDPQSRFGPSVLTEPATLAPLQTLSGLTLRLTVIPSSRRRSVRR